MEMICVKSIDTLQTCFDIVPSATSCSMPTCGEIRRRTQGSSHLPRASYEFCSPLPSKCRNLTSTEITLASQPRALICLPLKFALLKTDVQLTAAGDVFQARTTVAAHARTVSHPGDKERKLWCHIVSDFITRAIAGGETLKKGRGGERSRITHYPSSFRNDVQASSPYRVTAYPDDCEMKRRDI